MMKSESEGTFSAPPKTYGSLHAAQAGRRLPVAEYEDTRSPLANEMTVDRRPTLFKRGVIAIGVILFFGVTLSAAHLRWATEDWSEARTPNRPGSVVEKLPEVPRAQLREREQEQPMLGKLTLEATNEYGASDQHALALYELDMVIEPYRQTTLWVQHSTVPEAARQSGTQFSWHLVPANEDGTPDHNAEPIIDSRGGSHATVQLRHPGKTFHLTVKQVLLDGTIVAEGRVLAACKYVRRELRELTQADRTEFFEAMRVFYTISVEEGLQKYGPDFTNYLTTTGYHNSERFCYHNGMHFLTAHAAFNLWVERSLQLINPKVSLAFWDFMIDSGDLGSRWPESEIFSSNMYGSAIGSKETHYQISDGWFANISSIYDPDHDLINPIVDTNHNAYGYVTAGFNYQDLPYVTRTHSYCDMVGETSFVECDVFVGCFTGSTNLYDWATCMERSVHASMHGMIGGGFDCNVDMEQFLHENPEYSRGLLTFVLEFIVANKWPGNVLMRNYNECDTECAIGESCGCTCTTDPFEMEDDEVRDFMLRSMIALHQRSGGDRFVDEDDEAEWPYNFMVDDVRMTDEQTLLLLRTMMSIACQPGSIGAMSGGASPGDPIFWVLHPIFEKALHVLLLSPEYRDSYDFSWVNGTCDGSKFYDEIPFTGKELGFSDSDDYLTNSQLLEYFNPAITSLPYVYDTFKEWGLCQDWDPCPSCTEATESFGEEGRTWVAPVELAIRERMGTRRLGVTQ